MFEFFRKRRHAKIAAQPFPAEWNAIVEQSVPYTRMLDAEDRERLHDLVQIFLSEKSFDGAGGLEVTDEMRVSVAAQACVLLLGDDETGVYPDLKTIVLYPAAYKATRKAANGMVVTETEEVRLGESWDGGVVVLAWSAVQMGARDLNDGHNVVYHEFAHQLDQDFGDADGAPELPEGMAYGAWAQALGKEFQNLEHAQDEGRKTLLDHYGATNPAEFFAVATESFFEKPLQMRENKPELYAQLANFYRQDPATRLADHRNGLVAQAEAEAEASPRPKPKSKSKSKSKKRS
jgi:Mlc titration factor MtfA (ptsG expression regulator)